MQWRRVVLVGTALLAAFAASGAPRPGGGTIRGKVTVDGAAAKMRAIDISKEPSCAKMYTTPPVAETVVTGSGNTLENVVVYISAGAADDGAPSTAAVLAQKGCRYIPHVLAFQVGQEITITNDDEASHNVHPMAKLNREWNKSQPPGAPPIREQYDKAEFIAVKCNVHPWMHGTFAVMKNSHFAVTGADGTFTLANLPPGKYTVSAWHELYGDRSQDLTISGNETQTVNFVFKAKAN